MSRSDIINVERIQQALIEADVEVLLTLGLPADEYVSEARMVAEALANVVPAERTEERIVSILSTVFGRMFGRSDQELQAKRLKFLRIARRIIEIET